MPASDAINSTHPSYDCRIRQWERCGDCWEGQDAIKRRDGGRRYLPPTEGQLIDGAFGPGAGSHDCVGQSNYDAYLNRALFYGFYADAVQMSLGLAWTKDPIFEGLVDTPLEYLLTEATNEGESLSRLLYRINEAQIGIGRIGLLADMPAIEQAGQPKPYIATYACPRILNWDAGRVGELDQETLNLVVLDESGPMRSGHFMWNHVCRYRVLALGPIDTNELSGTYTQGVFEDMIEGGKSSGTPIFDPDKMYAPEAQGRRLNEIPFVFANATSATSEPVDPPLLSLADIVISLYQVSADLHQELHSSTQASLVTKGLTPGKPNEKPVRLGAGSHINLPNIPEANAFYLELSGKGLPALQKSLQDSIALAQQRAGEIVDQSSRGRESGNALEQRISVRTANLHAIVQSGATALERLLKIMGKWLGMSEEQVALIKVKPNYLFSKPSLSAIELKSLAETKLMGGAVLSLKSIHQFLVARGYTTLSWEEMKQEWEEEKNLAKDLLPEPENDPTQSGGSNGGPKILPASTGF